MKCICRVFKFRDSLIVLVYKNRSIAVPLESSHVLSSLQFIFVIILLYFISNVIVLEYWPLLLAVALPSALLASRPSAEHCLCIVITPSRSLLWLLNCITILPVTAVIAQVSVVTYINSPSSIISAWSIVARVQTMSEHDAIIFMYINIAYRVL